MDGYISSLMSSAASLPVPDEEAELDATSTAGRRRTEATVLRWTRLAALTIAVSLLIGIVVTLSARRHGDNVARCYKTGELSDVWICENLVDSVSPSPYLRCETLIDTASESPEYGYVA